MPNVSLKGSRSSRNDSSDPEESESDSVTEDSESDSATSDEREGIILVASIERRPFSLSPITLRFNGAELLASKFLRRERPLSR